MSSDHNSMGKDLNPVDFIQLQQYMDYHSLRVKDVMKELETDGKLAQYKQGECINQKGFRLFLSTYLEVEDFPEDLCHRLFCYLQNVEPSGADMTDSTAKRGVNLKDVSCYFSLLEDGLPSNKLEFTFKLYDKDGNGLLDSSEVDRIITQMMRAAQYLGWDVTELRPVLEEMMAAIDTDGSGSVTMYEWVDGGMNNVPLLVLLGLKMIQRDGQHLWRMKNFKKPTYCDVCHNVLLGLRKQGFRCTCCKYTVHGRCANENPASCASTFVKSIEETGVASHGWVSGGCNNSRCDKCQKKIKSNKSLTGKHCVWCHIKVHDKCLPDLPSKCDCGSLRHHILPPWAIYPTKEDPMGEKSRCRSGSDSRHMQNYTSDGRRLQIKPIPGTQPLLVFVNPKSGGKQGKRVLRKFQYLLNPRQVYNLSNGGPAPGLQFFQDLQDYRILACGGDGTVGWILDAIDKADLRISPPVAVLPLGTGNDLARSLGWGGGYDGADLTQILKEIDSSTQVLMDRWSVEMIPQDSKVVGDPVPFDIINNYFSIGADASIAHKFHTMREKHPQKFNSRMKNKLWYLELATSETLYSSCKKLKESIIIECCGKPLDLSEFSLESIAVLNIQNIYGGSKIWGEGKRSSSKGVVEHAHPELETDPSVLKRCSQDLGDQRLEVVGLDGAIEMGQIYTGLKSAGQRLARTSQITIRTNKALPMQIDGEPWMQPPCTIHIRHKNQAVMLTPARPKS